MNIQLLNEPQLDQVFELFQACRSKLEQEGIFQWTDSYPTKDLFAEDIQKQNLYGCLNKNQVLQGIVNISDEQEAEYAGIDWQDANGRVSVIHRLAVHPQHQQKGVASQLMNFAEDLGIDQDYTSIRLDAYSGNKITLDFYRRRLYLNRGIIYFPKRKMPFYCFEKKMTI